jgi:hypothetical protein
MSFTQLSNVAEAWNDVLPASTNKVGGTDAVLRFYVCHTFVSRPEQMHHET